MFPFVLGTTEIKMNRIYGRAHLENVLALGPQKKRQGAGSAIKVSEQRGKHKLIGKKESCFIEKGAFNLYVRWSCQSGWKHLRGPFGGEK